jgi:shikimate kinase
VTIRVVLVGLPGSGKSSVGAALASALSIAFVDVDEELTTLTGSTPAQWLREQGEAAFRDAEATALARALATPGDVVIATGGGAVETASSRARLRDEALVVELRCSVHVLLVRLEGGDRPLVEGPSPDRLARLIDRRAPLYAEVADASVDADAPLDAVVASVQALVAAR